MKPWKALVFLSLGVMIVFAATAQKDKSKRKSLPAQVSKEVKGTKITIDYSRPSKRDRVIFGELVEFGEVWRTGANETTWIELSEDVKVEGKKLSAGKYGLFTIPGEDEWVIIFNKTWNKWGAFSYESDDDILRVSVKPSETDLVEVFDIRIEDNGDVVMTWDETKVEFSIR